VNHAPVKSGAPARARVGAQLAIDLRLLVRNGESLLLVIGLPVMLLVFFSAVDVLPTEAVANEAIDFLAPGVFALAVMSTAFVNVAIGMGFEREYGVLKRLGASPLRRRELLVAKVLVVVLVEAVQLAVLVAVAVALGWSASGGLLVALAGALLATVAFVAGGLLMAGTMRGVVVLAAANGLYLLLLLLSGMVIPLDELPRGLRRVAELLPSTALAEVFHGALRDGLDVPARAWLVLGVWAVALSAAAVRWFRWEPSSR
jgi:ABC-2 type transport system permease protein